MAVEEMTFRTNRIRIRILFLLSVLLSSESIIGVRSYFSEVNDPTITFIEAAKREAAEAREHYNYIDDNEFSAEVLVARFEGWTHENEKQYSSAEEKLFRFKIWMENDGELVKKNRVL